MATQGKQNGEPDRQPGNRGNAANRGNRAACNNRASGLCQAFGQPGYYRNAGNRAVTLIREAGQSHKPGSKDLHKIARKLLFKQPSPNPTLISGLALFSRLHCHRFRLNSGFEKNSTGRFGSPGAGYSNRGGLLSIGQPSASKKPQLEWLSGTCATSNGLIDK